MTTSPICFARYKLPLHCAPLANVYARMHWAERATRKRECYTRMLSQSGRAKSPIHGRALIRTYRLSSRQPDPDSSWLKLPLDVLKADKQGLGFLLDDSADYVRVEQHWAKPASRERGAVYIEVWEDEPPAPQ